MQQITIDVKNGFVNHIGGLQDLQVVMIRDYDVEGLDPNDLVKDSKGNLYYEELWTLSGLEN